MEDFARRKRGRCLRLRRRSGHFHDALAGYAPLAARTAAIRGILLCGKQQQPYYRFQTSPHAPSDQTGFLILIETRVVITDGASAPIRDLRSIGSVGPGTARCCASLGQDDIGWLTRRLRARPFWVKFGLSEPRTRTSALPNTGHSSEAWKAA